MNDTPLIHFTSRGRIRNWRRAKIQALATAFAYRQLDEKKYAKIAARIANCANRLDFIDNSGNLTLANGYRCMTRMCPMCQASKAREAYAVLSGIADAHAIEHPTSKPVMLTLTVPNVSGEHLRSTIRNLVAAFRRLRKYRRITDSVQGWRRALEVSYNPERNDYHPHLHVLLFMVPGYLNKDNPLYLAQSDWQTLWQKAAKLPLAIVDIRRIGPNNDDPLVPGNIPGLAEVAKYIVKPQGYFIEIPKGWKLPPEILGVMHTALKSLRLYDYGGSLRKVPRPEKPDRQVDPKIISYDFEERLNSHGILVADYWKDDPACRPRAREPPDNMTIHADEIPY